jgi:hypothetical protein
MRGFMSMMSGLGAISMFFTLLLVFVVVYVVLRWRTAGDEDADPQLGIKAAINFLQFVLVIFALLGFSLIFTALFAKIGKSDGTDLWKWGLGMLWGSGVLFAGFEAYHRMFTNQAEYQEVRRSFMGLTLVLMGLISVFSFLLFWMGLFDKWQGLSFNFPFGLWLIFVPATGGGMILFQKMFFPRPAMPEGYPPAGGMTPGGGGGTYDQPAAAPQPMPEQPMAQEAPAPQPGVPAPQPGYPQPGAPAPQPGYPQPGAPAPQPGYPQPGVPAPQPGLPNPGGYPSAGTPAPQSPGLPGPSGGYGGGGTYGQ